MGSSRSASHVGGHEGDISHASPPKQQARELSDVAPLEAGPSSVAAFAAPRPPAKFVSRPAGLGHARRQTEVSPPKTSPLALFTASSNGKAPSLRAPQFTENTLGTLGHRRSATVSSKSAKRRARVSASMYEPPTPTGGAGPEKAEGNEFGEAEAFRARIEALRSDMGEGWLKVFNQSHLSSPSPPPAAKVASG